MRKCLHCPQEGDDSLFSTYRAKDGSRRTRSVCLECHRRQARDRQARYKERNGDEVRRRQREARGYRYWTDPEFRRKCVESVKKKSS